MPSFLRSLKLSVSAGVIAGLVAFAPSTRADDAARKRSSTPEFWAPPAFDASRARGKTVWWISDYKTIILKQCAIQGEGQDRRLQRRADPNRQSEARRDPAEDRRRRPQPVVLLRRDRRRPTRAYRRAGHLRLQDRLQGVQSRQRRETRRDEGGRDRLVRRRLLRTARG